MEISCVFDSFAVQFIFQFSLQGWYVQHCILIIVIFPGTDPSAGLLIDQDRLGGSDGLPTRLSLPPRKHPPAYCEEYIDHEEGEVGGGG